MQSPTVQFPNFESLTTGLTSVFYRSGAPNGPVTILDRQPNAYASTFPSEIITCKFHDGRELRVFCKYSAGCNHTAHGHRGGIGYEAAVYRHVLQPLNVSMPEFYGSYIDGQTDDMWLILEYLDNSLRVNKTSISTSMALAARWIGCFDAASTIRLSNKPIFSLKSYDAAYYLGWARRTLLYSCNLNKKFPWLPILCERFEKSLAPLLTSSPTVIHGECYPENLLLKGGIIYVVDWESAAIAAGEIDLVTLTESWPEEIVQQCEREYQLARWPMGPPPHFDRTLDLARVFSQLRWLGERPDWTTHESVSWRFERLRCAGERLGLL